MQLLYVFGQNNGELGMKEVAYSECTSPKPMDKYFLNKKKNIKLISKGGYHALIVLEEENYDVVYGSGHNSYQQLGIDDKETIYTYTESKVISELKKRIKFIGCGYSHSFIVTEDFKCYGFGLNFGILKEINELNIEIIKRIKHLICGGHHTALILENGDLYIHGDNSYQELDNDLNRKTITKFEKSKFNQPIIDIAFGINHGLMVTKLGEVYGCGNNSQYNQLGIDKGSIFEDNVTFEKIFPLKAQRVYCGYYHSFILTNDFEIYGCGWNVSGELCLGYASNNVSTFQKVNLTSITINTNDFEISVGYQQIFLKTGNEIYCGGYNGYGGLGLGGNECKDKFVKHPICEQDKRVNEIICGGHGTFFVMNDRKIGKKGQFMLNNLKKILIRNSENSDVVSLSDVCFVW